MACQGGAWGHIGVTEALHSQHKYILNSGQFGDNHNFVDEQKEGLIIVENQLGDVGEGWN